MKADSETVTDPMYEVLSKSPIFKGIPSSQIQEYLRNTRTYIKKFSKGTTLVFRGDPCNELIILLQGSIKGEMLDYSGKVVEVETVSAPRPIAAAFVFGEKHLYPVDAVAAEDVKTLIIPRDSLIRLLQSNPNLLTNFLDLISNKTHFLTERLWFMSFKTIKEKLAHYILQLAPKEEQQIVLPKTQQELSEFFGVSRPALARVIGDLQNENILQCNRRQIIIRNREKLRMLLQ